MLHACVGMFSIPGMPSTLGKHAHASVEHGTLDSYEFLGTRSRKPTCYFS